jgi:Xaa-Pro aminopeptidase
VKKRIGQLREKMDDKGLDGFFVSQPENRRYISGFTGSAGYVLVTPDKALLLVDFRYTEQAGKQAGNLEVHEVKGRPEEALPPFLEQLGGTRWGFESAHVTVALHSRIEPVFAEAGIEMEGVEGLVEEVRAVKDAEEAARLREAVRITDEAFSHLLEWVRPGVTEREASWEIEKYMREHGAERLSFPTIFASGPNGAMAHALAGERRISPGEPIVIDMGAVYEGYCADMTRTICLGEADERFWEIYRLVQKAQESAQAGMRAGLSGIEVDRMARQVIEDGGYGDQFGHGLGHAVGLAVHETPRLSPLSEDTLVSGVTITVEPGIYIPGWGGVRIEDIVLVQEDGVEILTQSTKDPIVPL